MRKQIRYFILVLFLFCRIHSLSGLSNDSILVSLSLRNVVDLAIRQSASVKYVQNTNVNYFWRWKNFKTSFRPQLTLRGDLPNYTHTTTPVTQPDGSIEFKQISQIQGIFSAFPEPVHSQYRDLYLCGNQSLPDTGFYQEFGGIFRKSFSDWFVSACYLHTIT